MSRITPFSRPLLTALLLALLLPVLGSPRADASVRFSDVPSSDVFSADVDWLASRAVTSGCNPPANTRFCPTDSVTRGQMAAFLTRALRLPPGDDSFDDVEGSVFERDIAALAEAGITRGCNPPTNAQFCPDRAVTRGEMAAFLARALNLPAGDEEFADTADSPFERDIAALAAAGITRGCNPPDNSNFCPSASVTRGQMAAFLHRALPGLPAVVRRGAGPLAGTDSTLQPSISDDGRLVAFTVWENRRSAIRVLDRGTGLHRDLRPGGAGAGYQHPMLSGNGAWILVSVTIDDIGQLWLVERATGTHHVIDDNLEYGGGQDDFDIDADGRYVVYRTANPSLVDPDESAKMFRWDRLTGTRVSISVDVGGATPTQGSIGYGRISDDGSKVMFESNQPNMTSDTPWHGGVRPSYLYVRDVDAGVTELVSRDAFDDPVGGVLYPTMSGDGRVVAYSLGDGPIVRTLATGALVEVPLPADVTGTNRTTLSADGAVLAFFAEAGDAVQLYAWDGTTQLLSRTSGGAPSDRDVLASTFYPGRPALAGNGRWAVFASTATNLGSAGGSGVIVANVFVTEVTAAP